MSINKKYFFIYSTLYLIEIGIKRTKIKCQAFFACILNYSPKRKSKKKTFQKLLLLI